MREQWRYRCPRGHTSWRHRHNNPPEQRYHCRSCARAGHNAHFGEDEMIDVKHEALPARGEW